MALAGAFLLHGCGAQAVTPEAAVISCDEGASVAAFSGRLLNNMWNRQSAGMGDWQQCLLSRPTPDGGVQLGWSWQWPGSAGLYAYPEIIVGRSPWRDELSNDARFPRQIARTQRLVLDYDVSLNSTGRQNLAADLWITSREPVSGTPPDPSIIKAEIMIWTQASPGLLDPAVQPAGEIMIDGLPWIVYVKTGSIASTAGQSVWTMVTYHAKSEMLRARIDVQAFLQDAVARGLIDAQDHVCGIELGNEIVGGAGTTWINSFDVLAE